MYGKKKEIKTKLSINKSVIGDSIETQMERLLDGELEKMEGKEMTYLNSEEMNDYTDPRADKWILAQEETDRIAKNEALKRETKRKDREQKVKEMQEKQKEKDNNTSGQSIDATTD